MLAEISSWIPDAILIVEAAAALLRGPLLGDGNLIPGEVKSSEIQGMIMAIIKHFQCVPLRVIRVFVVYKSSNQHWLDVEALHISTNRNHDKTQRLPLLQVLVRWHLDAAEHPVSLAGRALYMGCEATDGFYNLRGVFYDNAISRNVKVLCSTLTKMTENIHAEELGHAFPYFGNVYSLLFSLV